MIEPIKPNDSDVDALFQLTRRPGRIRREVHLPPFIKSSAIQLPPDDPERTRGCLPPRILKPDTASQG
jgi:hypothetical protein